MSLKTKKFVMGWGNNMGQGKDLGQCVQNMKMFVLDYHIPMTSFPLITSGEKA